MVHLPALTTLPRSGSTAWISLLRPALAGPGGGVALDDEQLAVDAVGAAVGELVGQPGGAECAGLALGLEGLLGGDAVDDRLGDLVADRVDVGLLAVAREPVGEALLDDLVDDGLHRRRAELLLGLAAELRLGERDLDGRDQALLHVGLLGAVVAVLGELGELLGAGEQHVVDGPGERTFEAGDVRAALRRGDGVDERHDGGVVALDPAQRDVDAAVALHDRHLAVDRHLLFEHVEAGEGDDLGDRLADREVVDVVGQAAARHELFGLAARRRRACRRRTTLRPGTRKHMVATRSRTSRTSMAASGSKMSKSGQKRIRVPVFLGAIFLTVREIVAGLELALVVEVAGDAVLERQLVGDAVAVDLGDELGRQRVDHRGADAVQATRGAVGAAAELAAGVQFGEHDLERRHLLLGVAVDRNAAAVVGDLDRAVAVEGDLDAVGVAGGGFVDRVVDELPHQVEQPGVAGTADVHARSLANGVEPFERLDRVGVVAGLGHGLSPPCRAEREDGSFGRAH